MHECTAEGIRINKYASHWSQTLSKSPFHITIIDVIVAARPCGSTFPFTRSTGGSTKPHHNSRSTSKDMVYSRKGCNSSKGATIAEMLGRFKEAGPTSRAARQGLIRIGKAPAKMWWGKEASGPLQSKQLPPAN